MLAAVIAVAAVGTLIFGGFNPVVLAMALLAIGLSLAPGLASRTVWGGWLGLIALTLGLGLIVQTLAPEAALIFVWPGLLAAAAAAVTAFTGPALDRPAGLAPSALAGVLGGAWLVGMAHFVFLGVGIDLPGALALIGLLVLLLVRPLAPATRLARPVLIGAAACLLLACGLSAAARWAEPTAVTSPPAATG